MARKGLIHFRCWYCNRQLMAGGDQVGQRRVCSCGERYRVPRHPGKSWRDKTVLDRVIELVVYGGGGGLLGFLLGLFILGGLGPAGGFLVKSVLRARLLVLGTLTVLGLLIGGLFGERGINWIGSHLRRWEDTD